MDSKLGVDLVGQRDEGANFADRSTCGDRSVDSSIVEMKVKPHVGIDGKNTRSFKELGDRRSV